MVTRVGEPVTDYGAITGMNIDEYTRFVLNTVKDILMSHGISDSEISPDLLLSIVRGGNELALEYLSEQNKDKKDG